MQKIKIQNVQDFQVKLQKRASDEQEKKPKNESLSNICDCEWTNY